MSDAWSAQFALHGQVWGIPSDKITEFNSHLAATKTLFQEVKSGSRSPINTEQCRVFFHDH
jgi:hypothetical protein